MANIYELIKKFHLTSETYKIQESNTEYWDNLILQDKYWDNILEISLDCTRVKDFFNTKSYEEREEYLNFGIACFNYFIQKNFTGPGLPKKIEEFLGREKFNSSDFSSCLTINNEEIDINTKYPVLLVVSELIFDHCIVNTLINLWWSCRALIIHQDILDELSPTLLTNADRLHKLIQNEPLEGMFEVIFI